jgi:hypothetical protein
MRTAIFWMLMVVWSFPKMGWALLFADADVEREPEPSDVEGEDHEEADGDEAGDAEVR